MYTHITILGRILFIFLRNLWSELLVPLVNMIKEGCENKSALFIHLIFN